jgi:ABC-type uncharacterized transport system substrate-binding protein
MNRRKFILALGGLTAVLPGSALGQRRIALIAGLTANSETNLSPFKEGLNALGYLEGRNFKIEYRFASGHLDRLPALAEELIRMNPDIFLANQTQSALTAFRATKSIPIVCPALADEIRLGLVASDARPGGNVTGLSIYLDGLSGKQVELATELIPGIQKIGMIVNLGNEQNAIQRLDTERAATAIGLKAVSAEIRVPEDINVAFRTLAAERVRAIIVPRDTLMLDERRRVAALAIATKIPTIHGNRPNVIDGCLMSYGVDQSDNFRRLAAYVDKILKGAKPGDLPVEFPNRLELVINLKTAKAMGIAVPSTLLDRADQVIE